jgi:hypothetical protein
LMLTGTLLDESIGGFSVLVGSQESIATGEKIQIRTDGGWFDARIVHVGEIMPTAEDLDAVAAKHGFVYEKKAVTVTVDEIGGSEAVDKTRWVRLGIRRLGKIAAPAQTEPTSPNGTGVTHPGGWMTRLVGSVLRR